MDSGSSPSIDRRTYLQAIAGGASGIQGLEALGQYEIPPGSNPPDGGDEIPGGAEWSFSVSDRVVDLESASIDSGDVVEDKAESIEPGVYLYHPHPSEMAGPKNEVVSKDSRDSISAYAHFYGEGSKYVVDTSTSLDLVSALYLPFVGSGYWRYTFALSGIGVGFKHQDFTYYDPGTDDGDSVPSFERMADQIYNHDKTGGRGFASHGVLLYQPEGRRPGELAFITSTRQGGPYARGVPQPNDSDMEETGLSAAKRDAFIAGSEAAFTSGIKRGAGRVANLGLNQLTNNTFTKKIVSKAATTVVGQTVDAVIGRGSSGDGAPDEIDVWEDDFAPKMTDSWDFSVWYYPTGGFENPVRHDRMFSVDVPPLEDEPVDADKSSRWAEFRVSDQYLTLGGLYSYTYVPTTETSNELSVWVPKLPHPENADLTDFDLEPYCAAEDDCVYAAPDVEPMVSVASPEVPWTDLHFWAGNWGN